MNFQFLGVISFTFVSVFGHGSMVSPLSRNAIDRSLPWNERSPPEPCICANRTTGSAGPNHEEGCN